MRYLVALALGSMISPRQVISSSNRNILSQQVRPHIRLLIQAVSSEWITSLKQYRISQVEAGTFCQAASSLVDKQNLPLPLFERSVKTMESGAESMRQFLQDLGDGSRNDDLRRAADMKLLWSKSIVAELQAINEGVALDLEYHTKQKQHMSSMRDERAQHDAKGQKPEAHLLNRGSTQAGNNEILGHSLDQWESIVYHHSAGSEGLSKLRTSVNGLMQGMSEILSNHINSVETGTEFLIKWGRSDSSKKDQQVSAEERFRDDPAVSEAQTSLVDETSAYRVKPSDSEIDSFNSDQAVSLGKPIIRFLGEPPAGGFDTFVDARGAKSPAEQMDKLTTTLNALQIRKLALIDAETSMRQLLGKISSEMEAVRQKLDEKYFTELKNGLLKIDDLATKVFTDVARYPDEYGVKINFQHDKDFYQSYKDRVQEMAEKNAIHEIDPLINLHANVAFRVHGHILAFFRSLTGVSAVNSVASLDTQSAEEVTGLVQTELFKKSGNMIDLIASISEKKDANYESAKSSVSSALLNARATSACLLYGRYDVLQRDFKLVMRGGDLTNGNHVSEELICGATHRLGVKELRASAIDHFALLGLDIGASESVLVGTAQRSEKPKDDQMLSEEIDIARAVLQDKDKRDNYLKDVNHKRQSDVAEIEKLKTAPAGDTQRV